MSPLKYLVIDGYREIENEIFGTKLLQLVLHVSDVCILLIAWQLGRSITIFIVIWLILFDVHDIIRLVFGGLIIGFVLALVFPARAVRTPGIRRLFFLGWGGYLQISIRRITQNVQP